MINIIRNQVRDNQEFAFVAGILVPLFAAMIAISAASAGKLF